MPDFLLFTEGANELLANGLPATCTFELSTRQIGAGGTPLTAATTHAGGYGIATGTGYAPKTEAEPTPAAGAAAFAAKSWATGAATDWPAAVYTCIMRNATTSKLLCAWHLQAGGAARAMNAANTTENFTPTLALA
jgi:hypothetical protein